VKKSFLIILSLVISTQINAGLFTSSNVQVYSQTALNLLHTVATFGCTSVCRATNGIITQFYSLSPETRQTVGFCLLVPTMYALFATITNEAKDQHPHSHLSSRDKFLRRFKIFLAGAGVGLVFKIILDGIADSKVTLTQLIMQAQKEFQPTVEALAPPLKKAE
jgi:hypothetical protein